MLRKPREYLIKRKRSALLAGLILVLGAAVIWSSIGPKEPVYEGKNVGEWLEYFQSTPKNQSSAGQAFKEMGTNAIPALIRRLAKSDAATTAALVKFKRKWPWLPIPLQGAAIRYRNVRMAFEAMGPTNAKYAVPQLIGLLKGTPLLYTEEQRPNSITMILRRVGRPAVAPLIQALTNSDPALRFHACFTLGELRASEAIAPLCELLRTDRDVPTRCRAAVALGTIKSATNRCMSALSEALADRAAAVRFSAAYALSGFGKEAESAVPLLLKAIQSEAPMPERIGDAVVFTEKSKAQVTGAFLAALKAIDPDSAAAPTAGGQKEGGSRRSELGKERAN